MSLFSEYATSSAFRIDLTEKMAAALHVIDLYDRNISPSGERQFLTDMKAEFGYLTDPFTTASRALLRRGLVEWHDLPKKADGHDDWSKKTWKMTEAGRHVVALCRLAGLVPNISNVVPIKKPAARAKARR